MEVTIKKTSVGKGRRPVDVALDDLDDLVKGAIGRRFAKPDADEVIEELEEVPSDADVEMSGEDTGHEEPDGDEIPEELKAELLKLLSE